MIHIIEQIELTEQGPCAYAGEYIQEIFLNQGSIDGACGPYSVLMGLLTLGVVDRNEVTSFEIDSHTSYGKLRIAMDKYQSSLFNEGTGLADLQKIISKSFGKDLIIEPSNLKSDELIGHVIDKLDENKPTIVGVNYSGGAHWMLAIGYKKNDYDESYYLLFLDPGGVKPIFCEWNSIIGVSPDQRGRYPYKWWHVGHVQYDQAISLSLRK